MVVSMESNVMMQEKQKEVEQRNWFLISLGHRLLMYNIYTIYVVEVSKLDRSDLKRKKDVKEKEKSCFSTSWAFYINFVICILELFKNAQTFFSN